MKPDKAVRYEYKQAAQAGVPFRILSTSAEGMVLEYVPSAVWMDISVGGKLYRNYSAFGISTAGVPGSPGTFRESVSIGTPPECEIHITIRDKEVIEETGPELLPIPFMSIEDGIPTPHYIPDKELYRIDTWLPDSLIGIGDRGMFRDLPVARIDVHPVQYFPSANRYRIIRRMIIEVHFSRASGNLGRTSISTAPTDNLYDQVVINYAQAKQWQTGRQTALKPAYKTAQEIPQEGRWYKMPVSVEGMYRITGKDLKDAGISTSGISPAVIRMYNNGGFVLPEDLEAPRPEGLEEIDIHVTGAEDGKFDDQDAIIFYGKPTSGWVYDTVNRLFNHYIHHYQDENIYWLQLDGSASGARMTYAPEVTGLPSIHPAAFTARIFQEDERVKHHESGLEWFADQFNNGDTKEYPVSLPGRAPGYPLHFSIALKGGSSGSHQFTIREGNSTILEPLFFAYTHSVFRAVGGGGLESENIGLSLSYRGSLAGSKAYLDWLEIFYQRKLEADDNVLTLYGSDTTGVVEYRVSGFSAAPQAYDVTDWQHPRRLTVTANVVLRDSSEAGAPRTYILTTEDKLKSVSELVPVTMTGLKSRNTYADYIILAHDEFANALRPFKDLKERNDSLRTEIVLVSEIYNEFSGGIMDAAAIRDFLSFAYDNWRSPAGIPPRYVLLVGDGDYDFKNILGTDDKNWIPPFEIDSDNDLVTRCTDDWFVYLRGRDRMMDMAVGRWPARSAADVTNIVKKHIQYIEGAGFGHWRTTFTLVADDELTPGDNSQRIHTDQSEVLSSASYIPRLLNQKKIYLMEYPAVRNVNETGVRKPQAQDAFIAQLNRGSVIVSFIGHGNHRLLAHERVITHDQDFNRIQNGSKYFFFYPATCAFGRYDLPLTQSFAEELLTVEERGAIGIVSSARDVFARQNFDLAQLFYENLFKERPTARLGDALMAAKARLPGNVVNHEKFHLLADPTLRLGIPLNQAANISITPDSLPALGTIKVEGTVNIGGRAWTDFDGKLSLLTFDSERQGQHTMENNETVTYRLPGFTIFRGSSSTAKNSHGRFTMQFIVPKDITYGGTNGRISVYYWGDSEDGAGYLENIRSGGTAAVENDLTGPEIFIGFQGYDDFTAGSVVNPNPVMEATISDPNGINITSEIGHKIELTIDNKLENRIDVSEFFMYNEGSFTNGTIVYPLPDLKNGIHVLCLKAWDNFNNSSETELEFDIASTQDLTIEDVLNYPNPFSRNTQFTFKINQPSEVSIKIYSVAGRLIHTIDNIFVDRAGLYASPLWDGSDNEGNFLANGVYFYKVIARNISEIQPKTVQKIGKIVIVR